MSQRSDEMNVIDQQRGPTRLSMSVGNKIATAFAVVLVLHLSIVVLQHYGLEQAERDRKTQTALLAQVGTLSEIDRVVGDLEKNLLLYTFAGYRGPEQRVEVLQNQLEQLLHQVDAMDRDSGIEIDHIAIQAMQTPLARHREVFAAAVTDREKRSHLVEGELKRLGNEFDSRIQRATESDSSTSERIAAELAFRNAQLQAMRFLHDPDSSYVRLAKVNLSKAEESIRLYFENEAGSSDNEAKELIAVVDQYEEAFLQMVQATRGYLHLVNVVLAGETEDFLYLTSKARADYSSKAESLGLQMQRDSQVFRTACNWFSVLTVILGLAATWLIRRDVIPPLKAITDTLDELSQGKACETIPGLDRRDDLGKLARAAQIFRNKAAETERLLAEVTRMKELERSRSHDQRMESLGQLAAGIAHEINTPMQCVASNVEYVAESFVVISKAIDVLTRSFDEQDEAERFKLIKDLELLVESRRFMAAAIDIPEAMKDAASAVLKVIEIVRAMKMMSHPGRIEAALTDVNQLIHDATVVTRSQWKSAATLTLELDPDLPRINCMSAELSQLVLNLLVNSADAIAEKRGKDDPLGHITVRTEILGDDFVLKVIDNGAGIPVAIQQKIFEPFYTTKEVGIGTGQGLAICHEVVKRHRGTIRIESKEGEGTTFIVNLPLSFDPDIAEPEKHVLINSL